MPPPAQGSIDPNQPKERSPQLAFAVFLVFLAGWFLWQTWGARKSATQQPAQPTSTTPETPTAPPTPTPAPPTVPLATSFPATKDVARNDAIVVDTDDLRARFSNHGAVLVELWLKKFFRTIAAKRDPASHDQQENWLPLVADYGEEKRTFALYANPAPDPARVLPLDTSNWAFDLPTTSDAGDVDLRFKFEDGDGHRFEKHFHFRRSGPVFDAELRFADERPGLSQGAASYLFVGADGIWDQRSSPFQYAPAGVVTDEDEDLLVQLDAAHLADGPQTKPFVRNGQAPFFGARSNYFALALLPDAKTAGAGLVENVSVERLFDRFTFDEAVKEKERNGPLDAEALEKLRKDHTSNVRTEAILRVPFPSATAPPLAMQFKVFGGARSPDAMRADELAPLRTLYEVEYGKPSLRWINRVLLWWMRLMEQLTRNWGVAIVLLTITVKVLLFPLNRLQSRTMEQFQKKMKLLQPQIDEVKKKYKNNLQKQNLEQQKLMREHGVRPPIFGCLVVFLQMPVWYGLFEIMRSAPELRQESFFGWISDLSAPDVVPLPFQIPFVGEFHALPIVMVVAWLVQNRMMPKPSDPQQAQMQKMMNFFPFLFGFFLYRYASGQSLYMLVNSLLGMLQMKLLRVTPTN